jgi:sulfate/thiosulfate transport system ATP-binding protein
VAIEARDITKRFGDYTALDDVTVVVPDGSLTALLGPSGSGKSTLLRVIAGLEVPDAGRVLIGGEDVTSTPARTREVGFVFQHYAAFKHMSVADNVAFGLTVRKRPKAEVRARVAELLELVGLAHLGKRYPSQLSRTEADQLELLEGQIVHIRLDPTGARREPASA